MNDETRQPLAVNIIVAHGLEAKPLLSMLQLERDRGVSEFPQYGNPTGLRLLVSGIGKQSVANAVSFLAEQQSVENDEVRAWLNIGIAGHAKAALGSAWLGNKIIDRGAGASVYPPQLIAGIRAGTVVTVEEPENDYPLDAAYEMEASAFYAEATKHSTAELVQVYKIISDNLEYPLSEMDLQRVPELITGQAQQLTKLISALGGIVAQHNSSHRLPNCYHQICVQSHLTVNQQLQLKRLCQRYQALGLEAELNRVAVLKHRDSSELLGQLREGLDGQDGASAR